MWEAITQLATWMSMMIDTGMVTQDSIKNLYEWSRCVLESIGYRMSMDALIILLTASKICQLMADGMSIENINIGINDLYVKPTNHMSLIAYFTSGRKPPPSQLRAAKQTLQQLAGFQVGSMLITCLLQELILFLIDLENTKP